MSELSDYRRLVSDPLEEKLRRRIAALERIAARHVKWHEEAEMAASYLLSDSAAECEIGMAWWNAHFNQPKVALSEEAS